jgi:hypothetical protein
MKQRIPRQHGFVQRHKRLCERDEISLPCSMRYGWQERGNEPLGVRRKSNLSLISSGRTLHKFTGPWVGRELVAARLWQK